MNQPPAFQFYVDNFVQGTSDMTPAEVGAYIRLLCYQWSNEAIPSEKGRVLIVAGGDVSEHVLKKFKKGEDGLLRNERMEKERRKQREFRSKQAEFGKMGGRPRKGFEKGSLSIEKGCDNGSQSPPSPSPSPISGCTEKKGAWLTVPLLLQELGAVYGRPLNQWPTDTEQRAAVELLKRPNFEEEKTIVVEFARRVKPEDKKFEFPKTLSRLLENWSEALDKARTYNPVDVRQAAKISDAKQLVASMFNGQTQPL